MNAQAFFEEVQKHFRDMSAEIEGLKEQLRIQTALCAQKEGHIKYLMDQGKSYEELKEEEGRKIEASRKKDKELLAHWKNLATRPTTKDAEVQVEETVVEKMDFEGEVVVKIDAETQYEDMAIKKEEPQCGDVVLKKDSDTQMDQFPGMEDVGTQCELEEPIENPGRVGSSLSSSSSMSIEFSLGVDADSSTSSPSISAQHSPISSLATINLNRRRESNDLPFSPAAISSTPRSSQSRKRALPYATTFENTESQKEFARREKDAKKTSKKATPKTPRTLKKAYPSFEACQGAQDAFMNRLHKSI